MYRKQCKLSTRNVGHPGPILTLEGSKGYNKELPVKCNRLQFTLVVTFYCSTQGSRGGTQRYFTMRQWAWTKLDGEPLWDQNHENISNSRFLKLWHHFYVHDVHICHIHTSTANSTFIKFLQSVYNAYVHVLLMHSRAKLRAGHV